MNYKNYLFTGLLISAFAVTADVPVGTVQSESATQKADQVVTMTEQSMEVRSVGGIEEVVVTAQKREQSLQDTPIALTAITASTIEDLDIKNVVDMAGLSPNVMLVENTSKNNSATTPLRGGGTIKPSVNTGPTGGGFLEGVYLSKTQGGVCCVV